MLKNNKGITLIELLMALALTGLVTALAVQMYVTNSSTFNVAKEQAKLTSQAQMIQDSLTKYGLESKGIHDIWVGSENYLNSSYNPNEFVDQESDGTPKSTTSLTFKFTDSTGIKKLVRFQYDKTNRQVLMGTGAIDDEDSLVTDYLIGTNVTKFIIHPLPEGTTYKTAKGIKVILELETEARHKSKYEASTVIAFRNREID